MQAPLPPPRKESLCDSLITDPTKGGISEQLVTNTQIPFWVEDFTNNPLQVAMYSHNPKQTVIYSEESNTTVSYTQKITNSLPAAFSADSSTKANMSTPLLQENYMQDSHTQRISTLKLIHNEDPESSRTFDAPQLSKSVEVLSLLRRPCSPPPNPAPETHTASLSIQIAPLSEQDPKSYKQLPELSPATTKIPLQQERLKPAVAVASQSSDCRVVHFTFHSLLFSLLYHGDSNAFSLSF